MNLTANVANQFVKPSTSNIEGDELRLFVWASSNRIFAGRKHRRVPARNFFLTGLTTEQRTGSCDINVGVIAFPQNDRKNSVALHLGKNWNATKNEFGAKCKIRCN